MPLFDRIVMVDWSAAAVPTLGRDSIWTADIAVAGGPATEINWPTREAVMGWLQDAVEATVTAGRRMLVGLDLAFGYPRGTVARIGGGWRDLWVWLHARIEDAPDNANNRFEVAAAFNALFPEGEGPLWGRPPRPAIEGLAPTKPRPFPAGLPERRHVEGIATGAHPTFKLAYPGSVGGQVLTGIARLEALRRRFPGIVRVWPFETRFADALDAPVTVAEIFPSLHRIEPRADEVRDAAQVRTLATAYAALDRADALRPHLAGPTDPDTRETALREEAWIVSCGDTPMPVGPCP